MRRGPGEPGHTCNSVARCNRTLGISRQLQIATRRAEARDAKGRRTTRTLILTVASLTVAGGVVGCARTPQGAPAGGPVMVVVLVGLASKNAILIVEFARDR